VYFSGVTPVMLGPQGRTFGDGGLA